MKEKLGFVADKVEIGAIALSAYLLHFALYPIAAKIMPAEAVRNFALQLPLNPKWTFDTLQGLGLPAETSALITIGSLILPIIPLSILTFAKVGYYSASNNSEVKSN